MLWAQKQGETNLVINASCNEIFGACLHKTKFHRFPQKRAQDVKDISTDGDNPEKSTSTMAKLSS
jgi:hypothetical protein